MAQQEKYKPDIQCFYDHISHQVEREDGLINNRLNWFLTSAGLLFAAFAVSVAAEPNEWNRKILLFVLLTLPVLGFVVSFYALQSVRAAERALNSLRRAWDDRVRTYYGRSEYVAHICFPRPYGDAVAWKGGHSFNKALPVCVGITWLVALQAISWFGFTRTIFLQWKIDLGILLLVRLIVGVGGFAGAAWLFYTAGRSFCEPEVTLEDYDDEEKIGAASQGQKTPHNPIAPADA